MERRFGVRFLFCWVVLAYSTSVRCFATPPPQQSSHYHSTTKAATIATTVIQRSRSITPVIRRGGGGGGGKLFAAVPSAQDKKNDNQKQPHNSRWPCLDTLDKRLITLSLPVILNFAIAPLIGAVDLFWVNRMGNALAVAGQSAANQVFNSVFWLASFLPSVSAILISRENARNNLNGVQDAVCQAILVGLVFSTVASSLLLLYPASVLSAVLTSKSAPALEFASPYLRIRAFAAVPSLISLVGFSAFRGIQDTLTPVKISAFANVFNAVLDPILIFTCGMGVPGAALATLTAEVVSAVTYITLLRRRKMILWSKLLKLPKWATLSPLLRGGLALQLRNVALNITFLAVARATQNIDPSGVAAAAHALSIQTFQVGGIVLLALSSVAQTVVPNDLEKGGKRSALLTVQRLMSWGFLLGIGLGCLQLALLPLIVQSTPLQAVQDAAKVPAIQASLYQVINGMVFIGEGVMIGTGSFLQLSLNTVVATLGFLWALSYFPSRLGLAGIWVGFGVFNSIRLLGVFAHQLWNGPLAPRRMKEQPKPIQ